LILGRGSNIFLCGQVGKKSFDFWNTHIFGVAFAMKQDITANPLNIGLLCSASRSSEVTSEACVARAVGVMLQADGITDLVKQFSRRGFHNN
jgi:hypothetical protein